MQKVTSLISYFLTTSYKRFFFIILFISFCISSCIDFTTYSDANEVLNVHVTEISSEDIILHKEEIVTAAEGRIILTLKGKLEEDMPLKFGAEFEISDKARILYAEKYREFQFYSMQDSFSFQVIAQSGLPKKWTLKLQDGRSNIANIEQCKVLSCKMEKPCEGVVSEDVTLYKRRDTSLAVIYVNVSSDSIFPLEIIPEIQLSENSSFVNYQAGSALHFDSPLAVNFIKLEAENRCITDWKVILRTPDSDDANLKGGKYIWISDAMEINDTVFKIDTANANAVVPIDRVNDWDNFSTLLHYTLNLPLGSRMELLEEQEDFDAQKVVFSSINDIKRFKIVSQSGREKIWKLKLDYAYNRSAKVENFSYLSYRPEESVKISLNPLNYLDTLNSLIYIDVEEGVKNITFASPLVIFPVVKLTDKASVKGEGVIYDKGSYQLPEVSFKSMEEVYRFKIYTESQEAKEWKILLRDKQKEKAAEADILKFIVNQEQLPADVEFTDNIFLPVSGKQEVILSLVRATFPLLLDIGAYDITISEEAELMGGKKILLFETAGDKKTFRVEAANGTEKIWTVGLKYAFSDALGVKGMTVNQIFPEVVRFEKEAEINAEKKEITLNVMDAAVYFPLRFSVSLTLPDKVRLDKEVDNLTFKTEQDVVYFHVISESGISEEWSIRVNNRNLTNDEAELKAFHAEVLSEGFLLGKTELTGNKISIPVMSGKGKFPLVIDIGSSEKSEGANWDKQVLTFEHIGKTEIFRVISQSGNVRNAYEVALVDNIPPSDSAAIKAFGLVRYSPLNYRLTGNVVIEDGKVGIEVYGKITTPLIVWPSVVLSEGAVLKNKLPDQGLEFNSGSVVILTVMAENGTTRDWEVGIIEKEVPPNAEASVYRIAVERIDNNINVIPEVKGKNIILYLGNVQVNYPLNMSLMLYVSENATVRYGTERILAGKRKAPATRQSVNSFLYELDLSFNEGETKEIYVISEDGSTEVVYTISLGGIKALSNVANVEDIKIKSYFPMNITKPEAWADAETGEVIISAPSDVMFPLVVYPEIQYSAGAEVCGNVNFNELVFDAGTAARNFQVKAEDGTIKDWKLLMKIAEKSNKNDVTGFVIREYSPQGVGLGVPRIDKEQRTIYIPMAEWIKGERLNIEAGGIELSPKAVSDFRSSLFFLSPKDEYAFNVTAENGDKAEWKVKLDYTFSREANITSFNILSGEPASVVYDPKAIIREAEGVIEIDVLEDLVFPFTIQADMAFSPKSEADLLNIPGQRIRFNAYRDETVIRVTAEDGITWKDWKVKLHYNFSTAAEITDFAVASHSPEIVKLESRPVEMDIPARTIWIKVADWGGSSELKITPVIAVSEKAGHNLGGDLLFIKKGSETKTIVVTAESGDEQEWKVRLKYSESSAAEITEFKYTSTAPAAVDFLRAELDAQNAEIILRIAAWNGENQLKVSGITYKVSDKATVNIPSELTFVKFYGETFTYKVKAQDGTEKLWTIKLAYNESNAAEITRFRITGNNQLNIIKMANEGKIVGNTIEIELTGGVRDAFSSYFEIMVDATVSDKATHNIPSSIKFMKVGDEKKYTVTAESGLTKEWTVRFVNNAPADAELLSVRGATITNSPSGDLKIANLRLDGKTIRFNITDLVSNGKYSSAWPAVNIELDLQLSSGAAVSTGGNKGIVSVKLDNVQNGSFKVVADNGVVQNTFQVVPSYCPQLDNWNMETWRDDYTPGASGSVWATANTSMAGVDVKGTRKTPGKSGSGALMYTTKTMGTIASGTIFTGKFVKGSISDALNDPEKMTHFGVPFAGRPKKIRVDVQYKIGNGSDNAHIWAALEYWPNPNDAKNPNNKRVAYGEVVLSGNVNGWTTYTLELNVTNNSVVPTHLLFVAASSKDGNKFIGAEGSELRVDNVEMVYE